MNDNTTEALDFNTYQLAARETAIYSSGLKVTYPLLGLVDEVGEVVGKIKKEMRDGKERDHDALVLELGDVLWYLAILADDLDVDLEEVALRNVEKLLDRKERGVLGGSGDYR